MEDGGLRKKKGCFGRALLSSAIWSLICSSQSVFYGSTLFPQDNLRIITTYTHDLDISLANDNLRQTYHTVGTRAHAMSFDQHPTDHIRLFVEPLSFSVRSFPRSSHILVVVPRVLNRHDPSTYLAAIGLDGLHTHRHASQFPKNRSAELKYVEQLMNDYVDR